MKFIRKNNLIDLLGVVFEVLLHEMVGDGSGLASYDTFVSLECLADPLVQFVLLIQNIFDSVQQYLDIPLVLVDPVCCLTSPSLENLLDLLVHVLVLDQIPEEAYNVGVHVVVHTLLLPNIGQLASQVGTGGDHQGVTVDGTVHLVFIVDRVQVVDQGLQDDQGLVLLLDVVLLGLLVHLHQELHQDAGQALLLQ